MSLIIFTKVLLVPFSLLIFFLIVVSFANGHLDDHKTLVFHHCSSQKLDEHSNDEYMGAKNTLFEKLHARSSQSKFDSTFVMVGEGSLSGFFQCRQDLDDHKCNECMKSFLDVSNGLCGNSMAARIQLSGCHVQYEADGYNDIFTLEHNDEYNNNNHKKCGENQAIVSNEYFEQIRRQAMEAIETEVADESEGINGFYSVNYEGFHVMVQCEIGLQDHCECAKCVIEAFEVIEEECGTSIFGQVYLELCYLGYEFNPHGYHEEKSGGTNNIGRIAAISIGGVALLFIAFMLSRCLKKKDDDD